MDSMRMKQLEHLEHLEVKKGFLENELENIAQEMDECKNDPELWQYMDLQLSYDEIQNEIEEIEIDIEEYRQKTQQLTGG